MQLSYHQCGFRPGLGTTDATYILKRAMQISVRKLEPLYLIFCDLSAAFDHVVRAWLFKTVRMRFPDGADTTLIDILENLYANTSCEFDGKHFTTSSGVRQGGPESPWLYTLFADFVMRVFIERCAADPKIQFFKHKFKIPSTNVPSEFETPSDFELFLEWLGYADDSALLLRSCEALQPVYDIYESTLTDFFLKVNPTKTKTQICSFKNTPGHTTDTEYPTSIIVDGNFDKYGPGPKICVIPWTGTRLGPPKVFWVVFSTFGTPQNVFPSRKNIQNFSIFDRGDPMKNQKF